MKNTEDSLWQSFCVGACHTRCDSCARHHKWIELNQLPDDWRKPLQSKMQRVDPFKCDDLNGKYHREITKNELRIAAGAMSD